MLSFLKSKKASLPPLTLSNTLSGELEVFEPLSRKEVKMYNCGPTVYDRQHIGNLRGPLLANLLRRVLEGWGYRVKHVSNITDVGHLVSDADEGADKLEAAAKKQKRSAQDIAHEITELFYADLDALGIDRSKILFTPATHYIEEQIALIQTLEEKGYAYTIDDGVYFDTSRFPTYGKLGGLSHGPSEARVEENPQKRNPHDFALWKFSKPREKRQQEWGSPWGKGFPGWHIECTAMIFKELGKQIDIHIGGMDLIPIHHNNEIAQAEAATARQFVRYWLHNEFITIEGKKVSKSLGNTVYLSQLIDRGLSPLALRYWYLTGHYRSPMNFTWEAVEGADQALARLGRHYVGAAEGPAQKPFMDLFYKALSNDLDTPKALALVWKNSTKLNKETLQEVDALLGLGFSNIRPAATLKVTADEVVGLTDSVEMSVVSEFPANVRELAVRREAARKAKDFQEADRLRAELEELGYRVVDTPQGAQIRKK